jgi:acyl carrier protein
MVGVVMRANEIRVVEIVSELLGVRKEDVFVDCSFADDLCAGSLDMVKLVLALEEEFDCEILDEDAENLTTVQKAIDYISERVAQE